MTKFTQAQLVKKQVQLEYIMKSVGIARYHANDERSEDKQASATSYNSVIISNMVEQLSLRIDAFIEHYKGKKGRRPSFLAKIEEVGSKTCSLIALRSAIDIMGLDDMSITAICERVGKRIEDQARFAGLEDAAPQYVEKILESINKKSTVNYSHKKRTLDAAIKRTGFEFVAWDKDIVSHLGAFLIDQVAELEFNGQPLMQKISIQKGPTEVENRLAMSEHTQEWIELFKGENEILAPAYAPCVIPPRDWTSPFDGGFHVEEIAKTSPLIHGKKKHIKGLTVEQMPVVYEAINSLQRVGWRVSTGVLDTFKAVMKCKLPLGIPQAEPLTVPPAPIPVGLESLKGKALLNAMTEEEKLGFMLWKADAVEIEEKERIRKAELNQLSQLLMEAQKYSQFDEYFYTYYLDYRSRVYVASSLMTVQGGDLQKALNQFAEGKKLGWRGAYWLAVQGAGVWAAKDENGIALDKKPFMERVRTVMSDEFKEMVMSIVVDPLNDTRWCDADKPWQFLNWCFEWADFIEWCEEGNCYKDFVSHLAIAQDGSCSGTQHYAMILKDAISGALVNLLPCKAPNDIYGTAADKFKKTLQDVLDCNESTMVDKVLASGWMPHANRNLCKPPVMTLVYGSAAMTCRKTTIQYLQDVQEKENKAARASGRKASKKHDFESVTEASSWATPKIWEAVGEVQAPAKKCMSMIKKVSRFAVKHGLPMQHTTPTGFIVTQEQFQMKARRVRTMLFGDTRITLNEETNVLDANKMASSSAPNFIHSMDASHLILSVWEMLVKRGLKSMAVIHDSFGVHACDTSKLRTTLKRTLVKMYTENDVLEDLICDHEERAGETSGIQKPELGDMDYNEVLKARYPFA